MPKVKVRGKQMEGWKPLPNGTYTIMIDDIKQGLSRAQNENLQVGGHVEDGPHDGKKVTIFYMLLPQNLWKLRNLLDATGVDYEAEELDEIDSDTGKPLLEVLFDTDDLLGCCFVADVSQRDDTKGGVSNEFRNERPVEGSDAEKRLQERKAAEDEDADEDEGDEGDAEEDEPEPEPEPAPKPAAAASGGGGGRVRRSRTRGARGAQ